MKSQVALAIGIGIGVLTASAPTPVRPADLIATAGQHQQHQAAPRTTETTASKPGNMMMGNMMAADAKLDTLIKTMNDARGGAKIDAVAAVVNALVEQHETMRSMMAGHMSMMGGMMNKPGGSAGATPAPPEK